MDPAASEPPHSGYNSTPSRPVPQSNATDIQEISVQYLALHDLKNSYFETGETDANGRNIFTVLHEELPTYCQLDCHQVASIAAFSLNGEAQACIDKAKVQYKGEVTFWSEMWHLQHRIMEVIEEQREEDSNKSNIPTNTLSQAHCRIFSFGGNRERPAYFPKSRKMRYRPDVSLVQLSTKEQATIIAQAEKEMMKTLGKGRKPSIAWGSICAIVEHKANDNLPISKVIEAKYHLILRGSAALNDNPFRCFIPLVLICGKKVTLLICDRSGVREFPTIVDMSCGDGLTQWIRLVAWLMFATPEQLGFFQGIGLLGRPTDCVVQIPKTAEDEAKQFKIIGDPMVHVTADAINHRATVVFNARQIIHGAENKPEELGSQAVVLKVSWPHQVRIFEGAYLRSMAQYKISNVARMLAGARFQNTDTNSRNFPMTKVLRSKSGLTSHERGQTTYHNGSCHVTSSRMLSISKKRRRESSPTPGTPSKASKKSRTLTNSTSESVALDGDGQPKEDGGTQYDSAMVEFAGAVATDVGIDVEHTYKHAIRILTIIVMPNYGVPLDSAQHPDGTPVTHRERVLACSKAIDAIADIYICAITEQPDYFPGMHRDISCGNIMIGPPGEDPDNNASLIDFDFAALCDKNKKFFSSGAPHRTGTLVAMSMSLLLPRDTMEEPVPHHRPYFDMESVFWSLYVAVLWHVVVPSMDSTREYFQSQIDSFCKPIKKDAGSMKNNALQEWMDWSRSRKLVERCGQKDVQAVWRLLTGMRSYLFVGGIPPGESQQLAAVPGFSHANFEGKDGPDGLPKKPWTDSQTAVDKARSILQDMFLHALKELEELETSKTEVAAAASN